jgi:hypothetical protein
MRAENVLDRVSPRLGNLLQAGKNCVFASISSAGFPISQLITPYPGVEGRTIDIGTGVAYPLKAERVRRDPRTGWLFESREAGGPVAVVRAHGAVRDSDIQANTDRYIEAMCHWSETTYGAPVWELSGVSWEVARDALWYWPRIWIEAAPVGVWWWPEGRSTEVPLEWKAPPDASLPVSDPSPVDPPTRAVSGRGGDWVSRAEELFGVGGLVTYLTFVDAAGYPWPTRVRIDDFDRSGFLLTGFDWLPESPGGPASLTFASADGNPGPRTATFVGNVASEGTGLRLDVSRQIADNMLTVAPDKIWNPEPEAREAMLARLDTELRRRRQRIPIIRRPT